MSDALLPQKILIVDGDKSIAQAIKGPLEKHNVKVDAAPDLSSALYLFNQNIYPVVLIELTFEELPGLILTQRWRAHELIEKANAGFVMIAGNRNTGDSGKDKLIEELDDIDIIYKPLSLIQLIPILQKAFKTKQRRMRFDDVSKHAMQLAQNPRTAATSIEYVKSNSKDLGYKGQDLMREVLEKQDKYQNALDVVDAILQQKPDSLNAMNHKGRLLLKIGQTDEALRFMEMADKQAPKNINRLTELAIAYLKAKKPDLSVEKMKELIQYHPDQPEIKFDMFAKLQEHGYDEHAINLCKDTTSPLEVVRHYNNKGVALAKAGKVEEAIAEYERALKFFPNYRENYRIYFNIALAHLSYKNRPHYETALDFVKRSLELNSKFDKALKAKEQIEAQLAKFGKSAS